MSSPNFNLTRHVGGGNFHRWRCAMTIRTLSIRVLFATLCCTSLVLEGFAQCTSGKPTVGFVTCSCTGEDVQTKVCSGQQGRCDPIGPVLQTCGGTCYFAPASPCLAAALHQSSLTVNAKLSQAEPKPLGCGAAAGKRDTERVEPTSAESAFRAWLNANLRNGR